MSNIIHQEIHQRQGTSPSMMLEVNYKCKTSPRLDQLKLQYREKYRKSLGIQLSKAIQINEKDCLISQNDLQNLIKATKRISDTHKKYINHFQNHLQKNLPSSQLLQGRLENYDEKIFYKNYKKDNKFMLNNAVFNTLVDNLEYRTVIKHHFLDNKTNIDEQIKLPSYKEFIKNRGDYQRMKSKSAYQSGLKYYRSKQFQPFPQKQILCGETQQNIRKIKTNLTRLH